MWMRYRVLCIVVCLRWSSDEWRFWTRARDDSFAKKDFNGEWSLLTRFCSYFSVWNDTSVALSFTDYYINSTFFLCFSFQSKDFYIFAPASVHFGCDAFWGELSRWVEHYILKGVTDALFLVIRNLGTSEYAIKSNAGVTPRGVVYTLRSVQRRYELPSTHTLRVSIYLNVGVSLPVYCIGFLRPRITNGQM